MTKAGATSNESSVDLTAQEEEAVRDQMPQRAPVLFEIIRRNGQEEIERPLQSLWWSGIAAGLSIGFSVLTPAMLKRWLPDAEWTTPITQLGYSVGFVIVILSRQQLFTENVITAVVPVMAKSHLRNLVLMMRLWAVVLAANLVGTNLFALFLHQSGAVDPALARAIHDVSKHLLDAQPHETLARGMVSGFLIASLVWILAGIEGSRLGIIVLMTYLIALGNFDHVVAGSVESSYLILEGAQSFGRAATTFFFPTLFGNLIGGTLIFTLLSYGQIRAEMRHGGGGAGPTDDDRANDSRPAPNPRPKGRKR
jgi:formate/nitrite transporter FocA (FNT family)